MDARSAARLEADLAALKLAAERAGTALACLFSSSAEFEAAVIRMRRARGHLPPAAQARSLTLHVVMVGSLVLVFLLI